MHKFSSVKCSSVGVMRASTLATACAPLKSINLKTLYANNSILTYAEDHTVL